MRSLAYRSIVVLFSAWLGSAQPAPDFHTDPGDLSKYNQTLFLPYASQFSSSSTPSVHGSIDGHPFTFPVDSGSTGLMIGVSLLPGVKLTSDNEGEYERGWEFLDSSSLLYTGRFVPLNITFFGLGGGQATSHVPVLVVQQVVKCPGYNATTGNGICTQTVQSNASEKHVTYMGVGFGRNVAGSGISFGTPDHNPFLNIVAINGFKATHLRTGYSLSTQGVDLGLTSINTRNAAWALLSKGATSDSRDWGELDMSFTVNGIGNYHGKALIDTGIPQMFIQSAPVATLPNVTVASTSSPSKHNKRVTNGTVLAFAFPSFEDGIAGYDFVVGDDKFPSQPEYVQPVASGSGPFVNTGRKFLFGFTIIFDAVGGRFGFICLKCDH